MNNTIMKNLKSKKLYLQVYDEIKSYIANNHLGPGDKLPSEMKMCEMLGVSRNVLREAIKSLEITGVVRSTPGVGIIIQEFNTDLFISNLIYNLNEQDSLMTQVEELRRVLEIGFAPATYENIDETSLSHLENCMISMENLAEKIKNSSGMKLGPKFAEIDAAFHRALFENLDNRLLKSIIEFFWACDKFYKEPTTVDSMQYTVKKHRMIYDAIKKRDYTAYMDAIKHHFNVAYYKS